MSNHLLHEDCIGSLVLKYHIKDNGDIYGRTRKDEKKRIGMCHGYLVRVFTVI